MIYFLSALILYLLISYTYVFFLLKKESGFMVGLKELALIFAPISIFFFLFDKKNK